MTTIETTKGKWLFVEVPKSAFDFSVCWNPILQDFIKFEVIEQATPYRILPPSEHKRVFIATTSSITEEQALSIVEHMYAYPRLLHANNLTAPNYAILKVI